ncbi:MAG TPA: hypothetical protein VHE99_00955 [Gammaproteobacteria bacterium]|nr:hypothetical protein [Gammaproteobacteria bacterium]
MSDEKKNKSTFSFNIPDKLTSSTEKTEFELFERLYDLYQRDRYSSEGAKEILESLGKVAESIKYKGNNGGDEHFSYDKFAKFYGDRYDKFKEIESALSPSSSCLIA